MRRVINTKATARRPAPGAVKYVRRRGRQFDERGLTIEAMQFTGDRRALSAFCGKRLLHKSFSNAKAQLRTVSGHESPILAGEWVIKRIDNEFEILTAEDFKKTYREKFPVEVKQTAPPAVPETAPAASTTSRDLWVATLPAGLTVHIQGIPFELVGETKVCGTKRNMIRAGLRSLATRQ